MKEHSILAPLIDAGSEVDLNSSAFADGLALAQSPSGLLHHLFAIRAGVLTGRFAHSDVLTLLSAVLVGHECKTMNPACQADDSSPVILMSSGALSAVYQQAFGLLGIPYQDGGFKDRRPGRPVCHFPAVAGCLKQPGCDQPHSQNQKHAKHDLAEQVLRDIAPHHLAHTEADDDCGQAQN